MATKKTTIADILKVSTPEFDKSVKVISFSQYSQWAKCPLQWKLNYIDKLRVSEDSIHTIFGTALHETLQEWIEQIYTGKHGAAGKMGLENNLKEKLVNLYKSAVEKNNGKHFSSPEQLTEFYNDGVDIINYIKKRKSTYFSTRGYEFVGCEVPLYLQASSKNKNVRFLAYVDLILRDTVRDRLIVFDIKTSKMGWNKWDKADKIKLSQVILYKKYLAEATGYPEDKIDVQYFVVKRKLPEGSAYPIPRVQYVKPSSGSRTTKLTMEIIDKFVSECFTPEGEYNTSADYLAITDTNNKNCKFCQFKTNYEVCPLERRSIT